MTWMKTQGTLFLTPHDLKQTQPQSPLKKKLEKWLSDFFHPDSRFLKQGHKWFCTFFVNRVWFLNSSDVEAISNDAAYIAKENMHDQ